MHAQAHGAGVIACRMLVEERTFLGKRAPVLGSGGKLGPVQDQITALG